MLKSYLRQQETYNYAKKMWCITKQELLKVISGGNKVVAVRH